MNICHGKHQSKRRGFAFCAFAFRHALVTLCLLQTLISAQLAGAQVRGESLEIRSTSLQQTAASLTGFQAPLQSTPFSLSLIDTQTASDFGLHALSDLLRSDPAVSDAYNTIGYPENFAIRGFLIDPRLNYRRDGLPINGHVPLAFENKASVLLLKGASGMFAGSASPGGLVDFVLKRPGNLSIRSATLSLSERGTRYVAADLSERFGASQSVGIRINLANETRRPMAERAPGDRQFASLLMDWRMPGGGILQWDAERHLFAQISVPGASLLDGRLLPPVLPRRNMNDQPWSSPFESQETASALRWQKPLSADWLLKAASSLQAVRTHDRIAFPDGCSAGVAYLYPGFCANGDADLYDFRSLNERRLTRSSELRLDGHVAFAGARHQLALAYRNTRLSEQLEPAQAYNWVGISNYFASVKLDPNPVAETLNSNRFLSTRELSIQDRIQTSGPLVLWLGLRNTQIASRSARSDGELAVSLEQSFSSPFAAISYETNGFQHAYLSYAQGVETEVVPNRPTIYRNAAQVLAAQRSKQWEASLRKAWGAQAGMEGQLALTVFRIERPSAADVEITALPGEPMLERLPAALLARHQGLEFQASLDAAEYGQFQLAAQRTQAKTVESLLANREGAPVLNVAPWSLHLLHRWPIADSRWQWQNRLYAVGRKPVLLANDRPGDVDLALAARWQWDSALHWQQKLPQLRLRWTLAATNLFDRADWREAPTQSWGGTYLFPVQARSLRMALQAHW
ncbi:MAG: TonB-dependent receptor [Betaproteobacteria bacterium]|nr:TonB-dependent receptor [Betaproteobacteria bacterium]NCV69647.1 TonB-dependent receptor [Betaproteobacteria bacterium]